MSSQSIRIPSELASTFQPISPPDLVRVGSRFDGGYVVSERSINDTRKLISFGNGFNVDFEYEFSFKKRFAIHLEIYDGSMRVISFKRLIKTGFNSLKFRSPIPLTEYFIFLAKCAHLKFHRSRFIKLFLRAEQSNGAISLSDVMANYEDLHTIFLKMDIEGSEYDCLNEIIGHAKIFSGVVIEFHDLDSRYEEFAEFIDGMKNKGFNLDHIHANNYSGITRTEIPNIVEVSLSPVRLNSSYESVHRLPLPNLDSPCSRTRLDYEISFERD